VTTEWATLGLALIGNVAALIWGAITGVKVAGSSALTAGRERLLGLS
jgi:hypothetical protein